MTLSISRLSFFAALILICHQSSGQGRTGERQWVIGSISIDGIKKTRPQTVLREVPFSEGDTIYIDSSRSLASYASTVGAQLQATALFHTTGLRLTPRADSITLDARIEVLERGYLTGSPKFAIADRNLTEWLEAKNLYRTTYGGNIGYINLTGRGDALKLELLGGWRQTIGLEYSARRFAGYPNLGLVAKASYERGNEVPLMARGDSLVFLRADDRRLIEKGAVMVSATWRPKIRWKYGGGIGLERYRLDTAVGAANPEYSPLRDEKFTMGKAQLSTTYDGRDHYVYPLHGYFLNLTGEFNISLTRLYRTFPVLMVNMKAFAEPMPLVYGAVKLSGRTVITRDNVPFLYQSNLGYREYVRGYERYFASGPTAATLNSELKYRLLADTLQIDWLPFFKGWRSIPVLIYPKLLADAGTVALNDIDHFDNGLINKLQIGYGGGVDIVVHFNQVGRIEYSRNALGEGGIYFALIALF